MIPNKRRILVRSFHYSKLRWAREHRIKPLSDNSRNTYGFWLSRPLRPAWHFYGLSALFSALTFDQCRLSLNETKHVSCCSFRVEVPLPLALVVH